MELKQLVTQLVYRIEPKPEGGFIARPSDPAGTPLEAATREELQQKIRQSISANLAAQFPALKPALDGQVQDFAFHIEKNPAGGFVVHSADPQAQSIEIGNHQDLETRIAEKLVNFVGKNLAPELAQALASQGADVNVTVNPKIRFALKTGSHSPTFGGDPSDALLQSAAVADLKLTASAAKFGDTGTAVSNAPIPPESSGNRTMFLFIAFLATLAAMLYFLLRR